MSFAKSVKRTVRTGCQRQPRALVARLFTRLDLTPAVKTVFFFCGLYLPAPRNSVQKHVLHTISGSVGYLINVYLISLLISLVFNFAFIGIWKKLQNNLRKKFLAKFNAPFFIFSYLIRESKIPRNTSCLAKTRNKVPAPEMIPNKAVPSFLLERLIYGQKLIVLSFVYRLKAILSKRKKHDQYLIIQ